MSMKNNISLLSPKNPLNKLLDIINYLHKFMILYNILYLAIGACAKNGFLWIYPSVISE